MIVKGMRNRTDALPIGCVTGGDALAREALALLQRVQVCRLSAPQLFLQDLWQVAERLDGEAAKIER